MISSRFIAFTSIALAGIISFSTGTLAENPTAPLSGKNSMPLLPDVNPAPAPAAAPAPIAAEQPPAVMDPCAAYQATYEAYVVCQDQMKKIQRMKDAAAERQAPPPAPIAATPAPAAAAPPSAAPSPNPAIKTGGDAAHVPETKK